MVEPTTELAKRNRQVLAKGDPIKTRCASLPATLDGMAEQLSLIACSLDAAGQHARLRDWAELLVQAVSREATGDGVRYAFVAADELERRIRDLAAAEQACCSFLEFAVLRAGGQIEMTVTAPAQGQDALRFIFSI